MNLSWTQWQATSWIWPSVLGGENKSLSLSVYSIVEVPRSSDPYKAESMPIWRRRWCGLWTPHHTLKHLSRRSTHGRRNLSFIECTEDFVWENETVASSVCGVKFRENELSLDSAKEKRARATPNWRQSSTLPSYKLWPLHCTVSSIVRMSIRIWSLKSQPTAIARQQTEIYFSLTLARLLPPPPRYHPSSPWCPRLN